MVNYKKLRNGIIVWKERTSHKYICYRHYKARKNLNKISKKQIISKLDYETLIKRFG